MKRIRQTMRRLAILFLVALLPSFYFSFKVNGQQNTSANTNTNQAVESPTPVPVPTVSPIPILPE